MHLNVILYAIIFFLLISPFRLHSNKGYLNLKPEGVFLKDLRSDPFKHELCLLLVKIYFVLSSYRVNVGCTKFNHAVDQSTSRTDVCAIYLFCLCHFEHVLALLFGFGLFKQQSGWYKRLIFW